MGTFCCHVACFFVVVGYFVSSEAFFTTPLLSSPLLSSPLLHGRGLPLTHRKVLGPARREVLASSTKTQSGVFSALAKASGSIETENEKTMVFGSYSAVSSGEVQVWESPKDDADGEKVVRTLWFESSPSVWQTAIVLAKDATDELTPDWNAIAFHSCKGLAMAASLTGNTGSEEQKLEVEDILIIGMGGGALAGWMLANLHQMKRLDCLEIDEIVAQTASEFFGLPVGQDPRLNVHVMDGLEFASKARDGGQKYDLIVVDACAPSSGEPDSEEVIAPPAALRSTDSCQLYADILKPQGVLAVNVIATSDIPLLAFIKTLNSSFPSSICYLENRDRSHSWMISPDNKIVLAFKEATITRRISVLEEAVPPARDMKLGARVRKELTQVKSLVQREQQLRVFAGNHPGVEHLRPSSQDIKKIQ